MSLSILMRIEAKKDIKNAARFINTYNQKASYSFVTALQHTITNLAHFPTMGKISHGNIKAFEFLLRDYNYWIFYTYSDTQLEVLRIVHTSCDN